MEPRSKGGVQFTSQFLHDATAKALVLSNSEDDMDILHVLPELARRHVPYGLVLACNGLVINISSQLGAGASTILAHPFHPFRRPTAVINKMELIAPVTIPKFVSVIVEPIIALGAYSAACGGFT